MLFLGGRFVAEHQFVVLHVESNGVSAVYLLGQNVFRKLVEHQTVDGSLHRTCTEFGVETFVGEEA